jgi:uncharacterized damage-inducible protein DinB
MIALRAIAPEDRTTMTTTKTAAPKKKSAAKKATTKHSTKATPVAAPALEAAAPIKAPKVRGKPPIDFTSAVLNAFATNERINQYLLEGLDAAAWNVAQIDAEGKSKGRTIAAIVAHMHNVRHMWLVVAAKDKPAPEKLDRKTVTIEQARAALAASANAMLELLRTSLASGGHVPNFKPDVVGFLGYLVAHEAHHRGQIAMLARTHGYELPQKIGYGMWEWNTRAKELETPEPD